MKTKIGDELIYAKEVYAVVGAAITVHNTLGEGFLEAVYQEAFEIELHERLIPFRSQVNLPITYKGHTLNKHYLADIFLYEKIIVELKAVDQLLPVHEAQLLNYLKASGKELGVLINFGAKSLQWRRMVNSCKKSS